MCFYFHNTTAHVFLQYRSAVHTAAANDMAVMYACLTAVGIEVTTIVLILVLVFFFLQFNSGRQPHSSHVSMLEGNRRKKRTNYVVLTRNMRLLTKANSWGFAPGGRVGQGAVGID